ncbi:tripartite tricarboxylate transporter substrate binding protein [Cupriavidus sp. AcVe19-1a]|uniref:Bug family tripartite tricarboxylate transporter substrate binding protein n=1 Tax=Cupriavidus sp. AcVe19-1a TaxID=2821359 RepID=UPI001AE1CE9F|nr:tripartite tricarboxylate transporter substrate binding protein [Cupriavidus sp. AcVe19-1a]MBP0633024.1 tripartite tricarboxylate transporter substrate binding protein [Cupriavidus sp. AcVe19-1a]
MKNIIDITWRMAIVIASLASGVAVAAYPEKPVRIVVPYPPGGASDTTARLLSEKLKEVTGGTFVVENRPGANGNIAAEMVAKSPADGYTLLMANVGPNAISQTIYPHLNYDVNKSFAPIGQTTTVPIVLVAGPKVKANDIKGLVAEVKANPGKYTFASAGNGSSNHLVGEMFKAGLKLDMMHVPYKGDGPAMTDVMAGQVSMMFTTAVAARPYVTGGKLKLVAVASKKRVPAFPNAPTINETVLQGFDATSWGGLVAPAGTAPEIVKQLNAALVKVLAMPEVKEKLGTLGAEVAASKPEEFAAYIKSETDKWGAVAKAANVVAE